MVIAPSLAAQIASSILALSKQAWTLGTSLSKLDKSARIVGNTVKIVTEDVKTFGVECDLLYAELEEVINESGVRTHRLYEIDDRAWKFLAEQVVEMGRTMRELGEYMESMRREDSGFHGQSQRQRMLDENGGMVASFRARICRHTDSLRTLLLVIHTAPTQLMPSQVDGRLPKLQDMLEKLQRHARADPHTRTTQSEVDLMLIVEDAIKKSTPKTVSEPWSSSAAHSPMRVSEWMEILQAMENDEGEASTHDDEPGDDPDDDLYADLFNAALETATAAFDGKEWAEADSLLQEALRTLQSVPRSQRAHCDVFGLHYKLAACAYHIHQPVDSRQALLSLIRLTVSTDEQQEQVQEARHLLSQIYIRMGELDRARAECEKALQARRRLLGKHSDAALQSMALMAHIYVLLDNRARAKSYLTMIPEARRSAIVKTIEDSLDGAVQHLDFSTLQAQGQARSPVDKPDVATWRTSDPPPAQVTEERGFRPMPTPTVQPVTPAPVWQTPPPTYGFPPIPPPKETTLPSNASALQTAHALNLRPPQPQFAVSANDDALADTISLPEGASFGPSEVPPTIPLDKKARRRTILERIGCNPTDAIETAVCNGDAPALAAQLHRRKDFWRAQLRKRVRPERLTALHYAALFGEIDMAARLLAANFAVNEVPFGYTTALPPLKIAIGARQPDMVDFLIRHGAQPTAPDSWASLASQLLSRSWLLKTVLDDEREGVAGRILAVMGVLLRSGWDVNAPYDDAGNTVLHQAANFWTGTYRWDLAVRTAVASFLCEKGADPFLPNDEGKTPYAIALETDHQELAVILYRYAPKGDRERMEAGFPDPAELPSAMDAVSLGRDVYRKVV